MPIGDGAISRLMVTLRIHRLECLQEEAAAAAADSDGVPDSEAAYPDMSHSGDKGEACGSALIVISLI